jgi:hypothetical protein
MSQYVYTAPRTQPDRVVATGASRVTRRPLIDLPGMAFKSVSDADATTGTEDASPLDVPAFLRRHEG